MKNVDLNMEERGTTLQWKSDKEVEMERRQKEEEQKRREEERARRKKEILESTDSSMDEMGTLEWNEHPRIDFGGAAHYKIRITKRQKLLVEEGFLDKYDLVYKNRLWVIPNNDLEAKTIVEMLQREGEYYLVTGQAWGASWDKLEDEIKEKIEEAKSEQRTVYGVELQGKSNGAINVDHHTYGEDNRSNPKSSIEQVAEILRVKLTLDEQFVSANDKGYIPAMEKLGVELGIGEEDLQEIIANIRMRDREMQGVTLEQEAQAQEAVEKLGKITEKREYIQLDLPHSKTSTVTDRLYGKYDNLLITSEDGETNFYGKTEIIQMLNEKFPGGWSGGQLDQGSGFWGGYADQSAIKSTVFAALQKTLDNNKENNQR